MRRKETPSLGKRQAAGGAAGASQGSASGAGGGAASQGSASDAGGAASQGSASAAGGPLAPHGREFTAIVKYIIPLPKGHKKLYVDHVKVTKGKKPRGLDDSWELPVELVGKWARVCDFAARGDKIVFKSFQEIPPEGDDMESQALPNNETFGFQLKNAEGKNAPEDQRVVVRRDGQVGDVSMTNANVDTFSSKDAARVLDGLKAREKRQAPAGGGAAPAPKRKKTQEYTKISALKDNKNRKVNVWGVVTDFSHPRPTRGSDSIVSLTIADESCPKGVAVSLFYDAASLPRFRMVGDVIRLKRVEVKEWDQKLQLQKAPGHHVCVWAPPPAEVDGSTGQEGTVLDADGNQKKVEIWKPYHCAMKDDPNHEYEVYEEDLGTVRELCEWGAKHLKESSADDSPQHEYAKRLSGQTEFDKPFDLYCRLTRPPKAPAAGHAMWFGVWDGDSAVAADVEEGQGADASSQGGGGSQGSRRGGAAARSQGGGGQSLGQILRVCVEAAEVDLIKFMTGEVTYHDVSGVTVTGGRFPSGAWLKLRNLRLRKDKKADGTEEVVGFLLGDVSKKLSVTALVVPEFHFEVRGVWERYDQQVAALSAGAGGSATRTSSRIRGGAAGGAANGAAGGSSQQGAAGDAARQQSYTIVSSAGFAAVPTNTVAEVMALTRENPVGKFRLRVSLGDFSPKNPAEFPSYSKLLKQWNVHFNITLSDPSGSITAIVANEDFEEFTGVTQAEMRTPEGQAKCATVLKRLSAPDTRSEVCLKTHVSSNENDPRVKYWLFATHLLAQPRQPLQIERELFW